MGLVKNDMIDCISRGYGHSESVICHACIGNQALSAFIKANGKRQKCSYCGSNKNALFLEYFMPQIMSGIRYKYSIAEDVLPYDSEYIGKTYSTADLIQDELYDELGVKSDAILTDIVGIIGDYTWCDTDSYTERPEDVDYYDWQLFCKIVKEKVRYIFYRTDGAHLKDSPVRILDTIADYCEQLQLTRRISKKESLFRCRISEELACYSEVEDFVPPPVEFASAGRMNAAGISVFYLTLDSKTALCETNVHGKDYATVACFKLKTSITVLDLTKIKHSNIPSIFDQRNRDKIPAFLFLKKFAESISEKATTKDTDYVPTQIITEYFRYVATCNGRPYDGIMYDSAQNPGGKCLALFLSRDEVKAGKFGIHIVPQKTTFYQKEYSFVNTDATKHACARLSISAEERKRISRIEPDIIEEGHKFIEMHKARTLTKV